MKINSILIVGGGSSGWMTAAALAKCLPGYDITLIESATVPIVGVGESTLGQINEFLDFLDLKDEDWMPKCGATYKTSIRFSDFQHKGEHYHDMLKSIDFPVSMKGIQDYFLLCKAFPDEFKIQDFSKFFDDNNYMTETMKFTNGSNMMNWDFKHGKAYHMDAYRFGMALKELVADPLGVKHIVDDVVKIHTAGDQIVIGVETKNNGILNADLFIDCTGFKSLLLGCGLEVPYIDFKDVLPNDTAIACNIPYADKDVELNSYTNCTAIENGWVWNIPIWERIGSGYCFSSKFVSNEQALAEYKDHLRTQYGDRADTIEPRLIKFVPGIRERAWVNNTVAIGLSNGFLEPLRSTGLLITHENVIRLIEVLSRTNGEVSGVDRDGFNHIVRESMDGLRDFVSSHYSLSKRHDNQYWYHVTEETSYYSSTPYYKNFAEICNRTKTAQIEQPFSIRILTGNGYNPISDAEFERLKRNNQIDFKHLNTVRTYWKERNQMLKRYVDNLPTLNQYLSNTIYKVDIE